MRKPIRNRIDPSKIVKHSALVERAKPVDFVVQGEREPAAFGFTVVKHKAKSFETLFLAIAQHCATPVWLHEKKTRVYQVVSGSGYFVVMSGDGAQEPTRIPLNPGDEVVAAPAMPHRFEAVNNLSLYAVQDSNYIKSLKELEEAVSSDKLVSLDITAPSERRGVTERTRNSKAAQQLASLKEQKAKTQETVEKREKQLTLGFDSGINARPMTFGDD